MSVRTASVFTPNARPVPIMFRARCSASSRVCMKAPLPHFTSRTRPSGPSAIFFDIMLAVISGTDSIVPVTSRRA